MYDCNIWLMSPPCQPYTRQGKQKDASDPRAQSFLHIVDIFAFLTKLPLYILIENVKGFEVSETRRRMTEQFVRCGYTIQEFHLSPHQFSIPNSRLRYFCLAKRKPFRFAASEYNSKLLEFIPYSDFFLDGKPAKPIRAIKEFIDPTVTAQFRDYLVPESVLQKNGMLFDIIYEDSQRSCCFTKAYGRYVEGTGSVLQMADKSLKATEDKASLKALKLRYFTPREIANLHGYPPSYNLNNFSNKQLYGLFGNSLNVIVVYELLKYLLREEHNKE